MARLGPAVFSSACWRSLSDCANAQADLDLHWAHMYIIGFVKKTIDFCYYHLHTWLLASSKPSDQKKAQSQIKLVTSFEIGCIDSIPFCSVEHALGNS